MSKLPEEPLAEDEEWEEYFEEVVEEILAEDKEEDPGYSEKSWKGFPMFQCDSCPFNHVTAERDTTTIKQHVWKFHIMPKNLAENAAQVHMKRPLQAEIYDPSGRLVAERDSTPEEIAGESLLNFDPPKTLNG